MTVPALSVENLLVRFGGLTAVNAVSLTVEAGALIGLVGPNGAGKTTVLNAVGGQLVPQSGRIRLFGEDVAELPPHRRFDRGLVRTFQGLRLYDGLNCLENVIAGVIGLGRRGMRDDIDRATELLDSFGMSGHLKRLPGELPFGKQKLVALARALIAKPKLLLLDEPLAGLHADEVKEFSLLLKRLHAEGHRTIVMVEHNLEAVADLTDWVAVLDNGTIIAKGPAEVVFESDAVNHAYFGGHRKGALLKRLQDHQIPPAHTGHATEIRSGRKT
jgi:ABC-type branched-subunit amino acid transport system ATPase component